MMSVLQNFHNNPLLPGLNFHLLRKQGDEGLSLVASVRLPKSSERWYLDHAFKQFLSWRVDATFEPNGTLFIFRLFFMGDQKIQTFETYLWPVDPLDSLKLDALESIRELPFYFFDYNGGFIKTLDLATSPQMQRNLSALRKCHEQHTAEITMENESLAHVLQSYRRRRFSAFEGRAGDMQLGQILVEMGFLTPSQLQDVLETQSRYGEKSLLGRLVVSFGYCSQACVTLALQHQRELRHRNYALGRILLKQGSISQAELEWASDMQQGQPMPFGYFLITTGICTKKQIVLALKEQQLLRGHQVSLGEILLAEGFITEAQLETILDRQKTALKPFGEMAIKLEFCRPQDIIWALENQISTQVRKEIIALPPVMRQPVLATAPKEKANMGAISSQHDDPKSPSPLDDIDFAISLLAMLK